LGDRNTRILENERRWTSYEPEFGREHFGSGHDFGSEHFRRYIPISVLQNSTQSRSVSAADDRKSDVGVKVEYVSRTNTPRTGEQSQISVPLTSEQKDLRGPRTNLAERSLKGFNSDIDRYLKEGKVPLQQQDIVSSMQRSSSYQSVVTSDQSSRLNPQFRNVPSPLAMSSRPCSVRTELVANPPKQPFPLAPGFHQPTKFDSHLPDASTSASSDAINLLFSYHRNAPPYSKKPQVNSQDVVKSSVGQGSNAQPKNREAPPVVRQGASLAVPESYEEKTPQCAGCENDLGKYLHYLANLSSTLSTCKNEMNIRNLG